MALYKHGQFLGQSQDAVFEHEHPPGASPPVSGIYRCAGCGREIVAEEARLLPPQNSHQHSPAQGSVRWRLIVYADHREK